jgi:hypothetical protein
MVTGVTDQETLSADQAQSSKPTGPTDAAWMIALLVIFAVAVGYFFANVIQFHLLPH